MIPAHHIFASNRADRKNDMIGKEFKEKLRSGEKLFGTCVTQPCALWAKIAQEIGLDFVFIDNEHWPFSRNDITNLCQIYSSAGIVPLVRIPQPDPFLACLAVDSGALGVVAPYVEEQEQVMDLVGAVKYSPLKGKVLRAGLERDQWHKNTKSYLEKKNEHRTVIINIESVPALDKLHELADVPGLDAFLIGPHDLTLSLGIVNQYEHPNFLKTVERIAKSARLKKIGAGIHAWWGVEQEKQLLAMGVNMLIHSSDYFAALTKLKEDYFQLKSYKMS